MAYGALRRIPVLTRSARSAIGSAMNRCSRLRTAASAGFRTSGSVTRTSSPSIFRVTASGSAAGATAGPVGRGDVAGGVRARGPGSTNTTPQSFSARPATMKQARLAAR